MNQHLQNMIGLIQQSAHLTDEEKAIVLKAANDANKAFTITEFKLDRTEKVKRTTVILLEETIEELEQKRKAIEAQNKELEIEAALEKVRSRSLAMQKSEELKAVIQVVYDQFVHLHINVEHTGFIINYKERDDMHIWLADKQGVPSEIFIPYFDSPHWNSFVEAKEKGKDFFANHLTFEAKNKFYRDLFKLIPDVSNETKEYYFNCPALAISTVLLDNVGLYIENFSGASYSNEENKRLMRFGKVFQQTYTRFLDLQKAEAQAREAQIEAALETVRSNSLAMQKSEELQKVITVVFKKLMELKVVLTGACICTFVKDSKDIIFWIAVNEQLYSTAIRVPHINHPVQKDFWEAKESSMAFLNKQYSVEEKNSIWTYSFANTNFKYLPEERKKFILESKGYAVTVAFEKDCAVAVNNFGGVLLSASDTNILQRFAKVFDQTYTRFLDLQKAEAQARESQIEAALERVRAQAMAMHKSEELLSVCEIMYKELKVLGFEEIRNAMIHTFNDKNEFFLDYDFSGTAGGRISKIPTKGFPIVEHYLKEIKKSTDAFLEIVFTGEQLQSWKNTRNATGQLVDTRMEAVNALYYYYYSIGMGDIGISTFTSISEEKIQVLERFRNVFQLCYQRYHDIEKAEAQSRESQIELSLERVRARTMAMQHSDELAEASLLLDSQVRALGIQTRGCAFNIYGDNESTEWFSSEMGTMPTYKTPREDLFLRYYEEGQKGKPMHIETYAGEACAAHYNYLMTLPVLGDALKQLKESGGSFPEQQVDHVTYFKYGYLLFITLESAPEAHDIFIRFAKVFEQTYTRFLDLQKAEAQAKESQIEAALERVRSRTLAMQKSEELAETSAVLFKQLIGLGISPNRLYISIMKDEEGETEFWITDEDGSKVSMAYADNLNNNLSFKKMYDGWREQKKSLVIDMKGEELTQYFDYLNSIHVPFKSGLVQKRRLQYIAYFIKGFIGMASPDEQPAETIQLLERFAYVFNLTFTRFHDLQIAEAHAVQAEEDLIAIKAAKQKAEEALNELQLTQKQLVQAEKMASLGELTAGIAHEIQNPLNFVNNFSEVSKELLEEMKAALENGDKEEADEIANDIIQNLEKINHHGKRADAIVKGMLQHSRKNNGVKELTDINALCDEYLRLSYHGLRAKDKSFNADFKTDFDNTIGKINIVPQDMGRVLLNLFNNAFYATSEKHKAESVKQNVNYQPSVSVTTKSSLSSGEGRGEVVITVKDNGSGISQPIINKIFQPFFTTKPTGEGTGLGLSLSYDIIKAHGGTIAVNSKEGESTEFIIVLPL